MRIPVLLKKQGTLFSIQGSGKLFVRHTRDDDSLWMNGSVVLQKMPSS